MGNQFLANIRETDAIAQVVRCFEDDDVVHVDGRVDPLSDVETINTELILADADSVDKGMLRYQKVARSGDKEALANIDLLEKLAAHLNQGKPARSFDVAEEQRKMVRDLHLITAKPMMYIANVDEDALQGSTELADRLAALAAEEKAQFVTVCAQIEAEIIQLEDDERDEFLADLNLTEPGLNRVIRAGYELLGLQTYFTAGPKEAGRAGGVD